MPLLSLRRGAQAARARARQVVVGPHVYPPSISGGYGDRTSVRRPAMLSPLAHDDTSTPAPGVTGSCML